eukprot:15474665-Alexandrium_andersonii.AAC.1
MVEGRIDWRSGKRPKRSMTKIMRGPIRRASFLKCRTEEEEKFLPIQINQARAAPVTHEQRKFDGFEIDARAALKVMEKYEG